MSAPCRTTLSVPTRHWDRSTAGSESKRHTNVPLWSFVGLTGFGAGLVVVVVGGVVVDVVVVAGVVVVVVVPTDVVVVVGNVVVVDVVVVVVVVVVDEAVGLKVTGR
jgi:hypothetical protein